jgi:hypothetical protein
VAETRSSANTKLCEVVGIKLVCKETNSKGNKTVPEKVATTCTDDGHKQNTKTSFTI